MDNKYKFWLGGFTEGEGSLSISIVKFDKAPHGIFLQPEFNVAQHYNGITILKSFKVLFNNFHGLRPWKSKVNDKGQLHKKSGSDKVWVYSLKGIKNLNELIIPFFLSFVVPYSSKYCEKEFNKYLFILNKLKEKSKYEKNEFISIIKLIYNLNPQGKGNKRKRTLAEILSIIEEKKY